jgi:aldose 1-epimerase
MASGSIGSRDAAGLVLEAGDVRATILPEAGGRVGSLVIGGHEVILSGDPDQMRWGSYPMAPFAGRIRHGRFSFRGRDHQLPLGMPPHAIHGVVWDRPWRVEDARTLSIELDERWPYRGRAVQRFELDAGSMTFELTLDAAEPMPATIGWHPWFRRTLEPGGPPVAVEFAADEMLARDAEGMPTGERVPPPPGPWDDAFTGVHGDPALTWPGALRLALSSSCSWWVVYTAPPNAVCVEPQSGPPDAVNDAPEVVEPGQPLTHTMRWSWDRLG